MENESNKIVFVILHYYTITDTIKCVNSIKDNINNDECEIIIVDNASPNQTGEELKEMYKNIENIHVIINEKNLGFARGNNIGFLYAKEKLKAEYIILLNNDTIILQKNFLELVVQEFNESKFAVMGPKILLPNNEINPLILELPDFKIIQKQLFDIRLDLITNYLWINGLYKNLRQGIKKVLIKLKFKTNNKNIKENSIDEKHENIVLHGSFLIFSKEYIERFDGLDDRTFLYREEELLAIRLKKNNLKSIYNPQIEILHNEDGATNAMNKNNRKKQIFVNENLIKSTKILIDEMSAKEKK